MLILFHAKPVGCACCDIPPVFAAAPSSHVHPFSLLISILNPLHILLHCRTASRKNAKPVRNTQVSEKSAGKVYGIRRGWGEGSGEYLFLIRKR